MENGGDAVTDRLAVAIKKGDVDGKIDTGSRHHLPLERVAVQIDDTRQHQEAPRIELDLAAEPAAADVVDLAICDRQRALQNFAAKQGAATFNENLCHDAADLFGFGEGRVIVSYFSRNSSTLSFLKSGSAVRSAS